MTYVMFFLIGLSGGSAKFASEDLCKAAGKKLEETAVGTVSVIGAVTGPRVTYFCISSGFRSINAQ